MADSTELNIEMRRGWKWRLRSSGLLDSWFDQYEQYLKSSLVKSNPVRSVFKINNQYFAKLDCPQTPLHKLRAYFCCKAESEFNTAMQLENGGVPVVKYLGWGRRGCSSMTFSEAIPDTVTAWEFWVREYIIGGKDHTAFLDNLAGFLKKFIYSGFFHPDFHLGNILYSPSTGQFALVDVYGITQPDSVSVSQMERMYKIVLAFRDVISDAEAEKLILFMGIRDTPEAAGLYFESALKAEAVFLNDEWPKRRRQIVENYRKFITRSTVGGQEFMLRNSPASEPSITPAELPQALKSGNLGKVDLPSDKALAIWLKSFRLQFYGIAHRQPLVLEKNGSQSVLYFNKIEGALPAPGIPEVTEFLKRCACFSISPAHENLRQTAAGRILINDPALIDLEV